MSTCKQCGAQTAPGRLYCCHICEVAAMVDEIARERARQRNEVIDAYRDDRRAEERDHTEWRRP